MQLRMHSLFVLIFLFISGSSSIALASTSSMPARPGQTETLLTDGRILVTGGLDKGRATSDAYLIDVSGNVTDVKPGLGAPRKGHSATALPDGAVLIFGGTDETGRYVRSMEIFDPLSMQFLKWSGSPLVPRTGHTATLLTDGRVVIIGGMTEGDAFPGDIQFWDFRTGNISALDITPVFPRQGHSALLLANGEIQISGGRDLQGNPVSHVEVFDSEAPMFQAIGASEVDAKGPLASAGIAESIPVDGASGYPISDFLKLRFTTLVNCRTVSEKSVKLSQSDGTAVPAVVTIAEQGRLAFLLPKGPLRAGSDYILTLDGVAVLNGNQMAYSAVHFHTDGDSDDGAEDGWIPDAAALSGNWSSRSELSKWQDLPALKARAGVTALAGQTLGLSGKPLAHVKLQIEGNHAQSDETGRFLLTGLSAGRHVLEIQGAAANRKSASYGFFEVSVEIKSGVTSVLNYTIWMTKLDTAHTVRIPSPTTTQDTVVTTPLLPGLELHLPAGTTIVGRDGKAVNELSITPIPLDKPPFPLPTGLRVPVYFTIQPGGAEIRVPTSSGSGATGARLYYPNTLGEPAEIVYNFWNYDAASKGWYIYGNGRVSADKQRIIPDPGVFVYELTGAMVGGSGPKNGIGAPGTGGNDGEPVDLASGEYTYSKTDLALPDVIPIQLVRTYTTNDHYQRPFGIGTTDNYDMFMVGDTSPYTYQELIDPTGNATRFNRTSPGVDFSDAVYLSSSSHGPWYGAILYWDSTIPGASWTLKTRDGTMYGFPDSEGFNNQVRQAAVGIQDRFGNTVVLTRDSNANLTQITSANGRFIALSYDPLRRINKVTDNAGRSVSYTYDAGGHLATVRDVNGGVTTYAYNSDDQITTITDARNITYLQNQYDSFGRVTKQIQADGSVYSFQWTPSSNTSQQWVTSGLPVSRYNSASYEGYTGIVSQVNVTDPRGYVRQVTMDNLGRRVTDTRALGQKEQETATFQYFADSLLKSETDSLSRISTFDYDALGNAKSITLLSGTSSATTYKATYDPKYSNILSSTDPLNHTWSFSYDSNGTLSQTQDPLGNGITLTHDSQGQPKSVTDAVGNIVAFTYVGGVLAAIKDPSGNQIIRFPDPAGRILSIADPMGNITQFQYDNSNELTSITNAQGHQATLSYDPNGNLLSVADFLGGTTKYAYDAMDRPQKLTDPLSRTAQVTYDLAGNPVSGTDRKGQVTTRSFDGLGRESFVGFGTTTVGPTTTYQSSIAYQYDAGNRLTAAVDSTSGTVTRTYDGLNRLTSETAPLGGISYTYDAAGRRLTSQPSKGALTSYSYDNGNRLSKITQGSSQVGFTYDSANRRTILKLPNGVNVQYGYDQESRLRSIAYTAGANTIGNLAYPTDGNGRKTGVEGSLAHTNLPLALAQAKYDFANEVISWNGISAAYDADGNMTTDVTGNKYAWNARNQLTGISGAMAASFSYDAFGRRTGKTVGAQSGTYLYDGVNRIAETFGTAVASLLAGATDEYFQRTESSGTTTPISDGLGSTIGMTNPSGKLVTTYWYDPYGNTTVSGAASGNTTQFAGRENDGTGLYFNRARYYNPVLGRFISEDPIGFAAGPNFYAYAGGDPIDYDDPTGLDKKPQNCTLTPNNDFSTWLAGEMNANTMFDAWLEGWGNTSTDFAPNSPESQQMMSAYGLQGNVNAFLNGGASSGFQNFGLSGLLSSGSNMTAQFVGSYGWSMSMSGGELNVTLTNATTPFSFFYHAPGLNPNPPIRPSTGWHPMGRVNQIFHIQVRCS